jgi:hypothetical protein
VDDDFRIVSCSPGEGGTILARRRPVRDFRCIGMTRAPHPERKISQLPSGVRLALASSRYTWLRRATRFSAAKASGVMRLALLSASLPAIPEDRARVEQPQIYAIGRARRRSASPPALEKAVPSLDVLKGTPHAQCEAKKCFDRLH